MEDFSRRAYDEDPDFQSSYQFPESNFFLVEEFGSLKRFLFPAQIDLPTGSAAGRTLHLRHYDSTAGFQSGHRTEKRPQKATLQGRSCNRRDSGRRDKSRRRLPSDFIGSDSQRVYGDKRCINTSGCGIHRACPR